MQQDEHKETGWKCPNKTKPREIKTTKMGQNKKINPQNKQYSDIKSIILPLIIIITFIFDPTVWLFLLLWKYSVDPTLTHEPTTTQTLQTTLNIHILVEHSLYFPLKHKVKTSQCFDANQNRPVLHGIWNSGVNVHTALPEKHEQTTEYRWIIN